MKQDDYASMRQDDLEWIKLRQELEEIRAGDAKMTAFSRETWYIPFGAAITTICFFYGLYHMNHPTKSIIGAYLRITSQALTGIGCVYVFMKFSKKRTHKSVDMKYHD